MLQIRQIPEVYMNMLLGHFSAKVGREDIYKPIIGNETASVIYWSEFLATDPEIPGSTPGATRYSEK
jgi:hypothetical protein